MWYRLKRGRAPALLGLGLIISLVSAMAAGALLLALSPAASVADTPGEGSSPPRSSGEDNISLDINDTDTHDDDYVPIQKTTDENVWRQTPYHAADAGRTDNGIPMKVTYIAPDDWQPARVRLQVVQKNANSGSLSITLTDGTAFPANGVIVSPNQSFETLLYGTTASSALDDITIKGLVTNGDVRGTKDTTVLSVPLDQVRFRGTNAQNQAYDQASAAHGNFWTVQLLGIQTGPPPAPPFLLRQCNAVNREETRFSILPANTDIPNVTWYTKRDISRISGGGDGEADPGANPRRRGADGWIIDTNTSTQGTDMDAIPTAQKPYLFFEDAPGGRNFIIGVNLRYFHIAKYRDWAEVKIGVKWYVISPYSYWRSRVHVICVDPDLGFIQDPARPSIIEQGPIDGFSGTWGEGT